MEARMNNDSSKPTTADSEHLKPKDPSKTHKELDKKVDEEIDESFPASDPPANY
jgi:hypothetical protein